MEKLHIRDQIDDVKRQLNKYTTCLNNMAPKVAQKRLRQAMRRQLNRLIDSTTEELNALNRLFKKDTGPKFKTFRPPYTFNMLESTAEEMMKLVLMFEEYRKKQ
jgi:hypothetical protein